MNSLHKAIVYVTDARFGINDLDEPSSWYATERSKFTEQQRQMLVGLGECIAEVMIEDHPRAIDSIIRVLNSEAVHAYIAAKRSLDDDREPIIVYKPDETTLLGEIIPPIPFTCIDVRPWDGPDDGRWAEIYQTTNGQVLFWLSESELDLPYTGFRKRAALMDREQFTAWWLENNYEISNTIRPLLVLNTLDFSSAKESISAPSPGQSITKHADDRGIGAAKKSINEQMKELLTTNPMSREWSQPKWASVLGCSKGTIHKTKTWKELMEDRNSERSYNSNDT